MHSAVMFHWRCRAKTGVGNDNYGEIRPVRVRVTDKTRADPCSGGIGETIAVGQTALSLGLGYLVIKGLWQVAKPGEKIKSSAKDSMHMYAGVYNARFMKWKVK